MAYFRCTTGGSGKGNTLVVTCADELAGATITCTNGTKTYRKTCPSTAPYEVTFYGLEAGTWTLSATVSGNTYTATVVITDCAALLGGFNWRTWVDTAQFLDSSDYDSLSEVLADELAVRELALEHACVDYMAEIATASADVETIINTDLFAKWVNNSDYALDKMSANAAIKTVMDTADKYGYGEWVITDDTTTPVTWGPKGNVPVMTSNNAPYGTALSSSNVSGYEAYKAFNNDVTTGHASANNGYIQYEFVNPICPRMVYSRFAPQAQNVPSTYVVSGSNDGSNFTPLKTVTVQQVADAENRETIENDAYYKIVLVTFGTSTSGSINIRALQFYGRELSVSVPKMTSNTVPYGVVSAVNGRGSGYEPYKVFDNDASTAFESSGTTAKVIYKFPHPVCIKRVSAVGGSGRTISCAVKGSNDGSTWSDSLATFTTTDGTTLVTTDINNNDSYLYYAVDASVASGNVRFATIQFYGEDHIEKEFEEGTTKKWLYDHGVELEPINYALATTTSTAINDGERIQFNTNASTANGIGTASLIDLSNYDLIRAKVGENFYSSGSEAFFYVSEQASLVGIGPEASSSYAMGNGNLPNNLALDVSSVNSQRCVIVYCQYGTRTQKADLTEWWLE